jgi:formyltetrahydrofolate deformylase
VAVAVTLTAPTAAGGELGADGAPIVRLIVSCPDQPGIVAAVSGLLGEAGANIVTSDQYSTGNGSGRFFMRMQFSLPAECDQAELEARFEADVAAGFGMSWGMWRADRPKRVAILVSRYDHCLLDLLWRWRRDELGGSVTLVASNHPDLRLEAESAGLPYHHVSVEKGAKPEAEARLLELLDGNCDVVVLARYMQILSAEFLERVGVPVINIHHSFLPAFAGAGPHRRAKDRGVKLIGATAHYVTEELDAGPIIEQDVVRVDHRDDVAALVRKGAEIERAVLARAVRWHCEDRVLRQDNTTVVF